MPRAFRRNRRLRAGDLRLLHDLAVLGRALDERNVPMRERLERALGPDLVCPALSPPAASATRAA
jgi:hypothetical protein